MKKFLHPRGGASKGAALIIVLAIVVLATGLGLAYFSRTTTNRQLAQSSYHDTSADLLARSALDIVVSNLKQEIPTSAPTPPIGPTNIQPQRSGDNALIPNLIRRSVFPDNIGSPGVSSLASAVTSGPADVNNVKRGEITSARWNSHYLIPPGEVNFTAPNWVLVTRNGPVVFSGWDSSLKDTTSNNYVLGRYAFAVYDEGGLIDVNLGGFPGYLSLSRPARPSRKLRPTYPEEESEIILADCQAPDLTPNRTNASGTTGTLIQPIQLKANHNPTSFSVSFLPSGLSLDANTGIISGIPTTPGGFTITSRASNQCGTGTGTLYVRIDGRIGPESTPWPVNLARKGTVAFADLTALPSTPTLTAAQINKLMGWRNYATTQQPTSASFNTPYFPAVAATEDLYANYFLGAFPPPDYVFDTAFTTVRNDIPLVNGRTDQAVMSRQELIKLQRTIGFNSSVLQYLGTFSRDVNRPSPDWSRTLAARWDMNNLQGVIPDAWIAPGHHGQGHAFGLQRHSMIGQLFGLVWQPGRFIAGTRLTDPNYYGRWNYIHNLTDWSDDADFFQIIYNAMKMGNGGTAPNPKDVFTVGAAIIDQYDTEDLYDPNPDPDTCNGNCGNTITIIDTVGSGNPADYVCGIEDLSFHDPTTDSARPGSIGSFCPYPPPVPAGPTPPRYALLNRRFENVGEFGYAYSPASTTPSKTLDFASSTSKDKPLLDFFTYNTGTGRAGIVNLNTRNGPVLASYIKGALLHDLGSENPPTALVSQADALTAGQNIVVATTAPGGSVVNRGDVARLAVAAVQGTAMAASDEARQTIARTLAEVGQARTWNLMIDVIAQTGHYGPNAQGLTDFIPEGEKRYWLHIAFDRDDGTVLGTQLEEVIE